MRPARQHSARHTSDAQRRRIAELITDASIEVAPRDELAGAGLSEWFGPGRRVLVNHPGSVTHHDIVAACASLRRAGFIPMPHVAARRLASYTQADDFVRRAVGEAGVEEVLLVGGDPNHPTGPFHDSMSLLTSGVIERHGIHSVAFAGYPEGHPSIAAKVLNAALHAKIALAGRLGLEARIITQFGFEPLPVERWIAALRNDGFACPVVVGVAGPASVATLARYAIRCGIGASLRALARGHAAFARILTEATPTALVEALVASETPTTLIDGLHFFAFGGTRPTSEWIRTYLNEIC